MIRLTAWSAARGGADRPDAVPRRSPSETMLDQLPAPFQPGDLQPQPDDGPRESTGEVGRGVRDGPGAGRAGSRWRPSAPRSGTGARRVPRRSTPGRARGRRRGSRSGRPCRAGAWSRTRTATRRAAVPGRSRAGWPERTSGADRLPMRIGTRDVGFEHGDAVLLLEDHRRVGSVAVAGRLGDQMTSWMSRIVAARTSKRSSLTCSGVYMAGLTGWAAEAGTVRCRLSSRVIRGLWRGQVRIGVTADRPGRTASRRRGCPRCPG